MQEPTVITLTNESEAYHKAKSFLQSAFDKNAKINLTTLATEDRLTVEQIIIAFAKREFIGEIKYDFVYPDQIYSNAHANIRFSSQQFLKILDIIVTHFPDLTPKIIAILLDQEFDELFVQAKYDEHVDLYLTILEKIQLQGNIIDVGGLLARAPKTYDRNFWNHFIYKLAKSENEKNIIKLFKLLETQIKKSGYDQNTTELFNIPLERFFWILSLVILPKRSKELLLAYMSFVEESYQVFFDHRILSHLLLGFSTAYGFPFVLRSPTIAYKMACLQDIQYTCNLMYWLLIEHELPKHANNGLKAFSIPMLPQDLSFLSHENLFSQRIAILAHIKNLPKDERKIALIRTITPNLSLYNFFYKPIDSRISLQIDQLLRFHSAETDIQKLLEQNQDDSTTNNRQATIETALRSLFALDDPNEVVDILSQTDKEGKHIAFYLDEVIFHIYLKLLNFLLGKDVCPTKMANLLCSHEKQTEDTKGYHLATWTNKIPLTYRPLFINILLTTYNEQIIKLGLAKFIDTRIQEGDSFSNFLTRQLKLVSTNTDRGNYINYFTLLRTIYDSNSSPLSHDRWCLISHMETCSHVLGAGLFPKIIKQQQIINLLKEQATNYKAVEHFLENLPKDNADPNEVADLLATTDEHGAHLGIYLARHIAEESRSIGFFGSFEDRHIVSYLKLLLLLLSKKDVNPEKITALLMAKNGSTQPLALELKDKQSVKLFFEIAKKLPVHCRLKLFTEDLLYRFYAISLSSSERQKTLVHTSLQLLHTTLLNSDANIAEQILNILSVRSGTVNFVLLITNNRVFSDASFVFLQILENVITRFSHLIPKVSHILSTLESDNNQVSGSLFIIKEFSNNFLALKEKILEKTQTPKEQLQIQEFLKQENKDINAIEALLTSLVDSEYDPNTIIKMLAEVDARGTNIAFYLTNTVIYFRLLSSLLEKEGSAFEKEGRAYNITGLLSLQEDICGSTLGHHLCNYDKFIELINKLPLDCQILLLSIENYKGDLFLEYVNNETVDRYLTILHKGSLSKDKETVKTVMKIISKLVKKFPLATNNVIVIFFANSQSNSSDQFRFFSQLFASLKDCNNTEADEVYVSFIRVLYHNKNIPEIAYLLANELGSKRFKNLFSNLLHNHATEENKRKILDYIEQLPKNERMEACENVFKFAHPLREFFTYSSDVKLQDIQKLLDQDKQTSSSHSGASRFHKSHEVRKVKGETANFDEEETAEDKLGAEL